MKSVWIVAIALAFTFSGSAQAIFLRPDLEKIPVDRLIENLQEASKKEPKNVMLQINLARVYAMAYARKVDMVDVQKGKEKVGAWFGFEPSHMPVGPVQKTDDPKRMAAAKEYLAKSVTVYQAIVKDAGDNLVARIGLGWVLAESGDKDEAKKVLRKLLEDAWVKEKELRVLGLGGHTFTGEGAGYLIPHLDKEKDKEEIAMLEDRSKKLKMLPRPITPIAIPMRDGLKATDLEDRSASVSFDLDGSGLQRKWTWITRDAGWLVYDPKASGKVTSGLQLFGNVTFWLFWETGYDALASLDNNHDGQLNGSELNGLAIWHDINGNGTADEGEVRSLAAHGIVGVSTRFQRDTAHPDRIAYSANGVQFRDGKTRPTFDLILRSK